MQQSDWSCPQYTNEERECGHLESLHHTSTGASTAITGGLPVEGPAVDRPTLFSLLASISFGF
jgi:hypothetical protein